jgi:hypothetical protein
MSDSLIENKLFAKYKLHHVIFWMLFLAFWMAIFASVTVNFELNLIYTGTFVLLQIFSVYFTNHYLVPKFLYTKKYAKFAGSILLLVLAAGALLVTVDWYLFLPYRSPRESVYFWNTGNLIYGSFLLVFFTTAAGGAIKFFSDHYKIQNKLEQIIQEKSDTELKFLKSQLNPHFIFNCLNSIYFLIDKENTEARNYLGKFSEMLRYQLYDCNVEKIDISQEVKYLQNYVATQKLRRDSNYKISFNVDSNLSDVKIAPLVMIPFVENAFKHVSNHLDRDNLIDIHLTRNNGSLLFEVNNTKDSAEIKEFQNVGGIGLTNVCRRLELIYPGRYNLDIDESPEKYSVKLQIEIGEN